MVEKAKVSWAGAHHILCTRLLKKAEQSVKKSISSMSLGHVTVEVECIEDRIEVRFASRKSKKPILISEDNKKTIRNFMLGEFKVRMSKSATDNGIGEIRIRACGDKKSKTEYYWLMERKVRYT